MNQVSLTCILYELTNYHLFWRVMRAYAPFTRRLLGCRTITGMQSVESSLERRPTHDPKDGGGRIASGTAIEEAKVDAAMITVASTRITHQLVRITPPIHIICRFIIFKCSKGNL